MNTPKFENKTAYTVAGFKSIDHIVSEVFCVPVDKLSERTRIREVADARAVAMWWRRRNSTDSFSVIAKIYKLDHATVIHSVKKINQLIDVDREIKNKVELIEAMAAPMLTHKPIKLQNVRITNVELRRNLFEAYIEGVKLSGGLRFQDMARPKQYNILREFISFYKNKLSNTK